MPAFNDITDMINAGTMGFFASTAAVPFGYRLLISAGATTALGFASRGYGGRECNRWAMSSLAIAPVMLGFVMDYLLELDSEIVAPAMISVALIFNIINKKTRCLEDDAYNQVVMTEQTMRRVAKLEREFKDFPDFTA